MIVIKQREVPRLMLQTEALNRRLDPNHEMKTRVETNARNLRAGYNGEKSIDFMLDFLSDDYHIFHYLRLPDSHGCFQIDTYVLSFFFSLIIEVKNIICTITFDGMGQSLRMRDGIEANFHNPVDQIGLQQHRLQNWIHPLNLPPIPLETLIVYTHPQAILKNNTNRSSLANLIIRKENLLFKINELAKKHPHPILSEKQMLMFGNHLLHSHTPENIDIMKKFNLSSKDLRLGVACPQCEAIPMTRIQGRWLCEKCKYKSKNAHINALKDYSLIIGKKITNRQARHFLQLKSEHTSKYILNQFSFEKIGSTRGTKYILSFE